MFSRVAILGVGLIGGSLGLALKSRGLAGEIIGIGRNAARLQPAIDVGAIDQFALDFDPIPTCDFVFLATPIPQIIADLPKLAALISPDALMTDAGSTKSSIAQAGAGIAGFIPSHPMAGSEKTGVEFARADLFDGATWAVTPHINNTLERTARLTDLTDLIAELGATPLVLTPETHDSLVATTSHLPHLMAFALIHQARAQEKIHPELFALAAGSFASATRVAHADPTLWAGICHDNRLALLESLHAYQDELRTVEAILKSGDVDALGAWIKQNSL
jgi:prephenate dehydrogenase